jgi:hypothetical protein
VNANGAEAVALASSRQMTAPDEWERSVVTRGALLHFDGGTVAEWRSAGGS